jgi:hypothetical protein
MTLPLHEALDRRRECYGVLRAPGPCLHLCVAWLKRSAIGAGRVRDFGDSRSSWVGTRSRRGFRLEDWRKGHATTEALRETGRARSRCRTSLRWSVRRVTCVGSLELGYRVAQ